MREDRRLATASVALLAAVGMVATLAACTAPPAPSPSPVQTRTSAPATTAPPKVDPSLPPMARLYKTLQLDPATASLFTAANPPLTYDEANDVLVVDPGQMKALMADPVISAIDTNAAGEPLKVRIEDAGSYKFLAKLKSDVTLYAGLGYVTAQVAKLKNVTAVALDEKDYWVTTLRELPYVKTIYLVTPRDFPAGKVFVVDLRFLTKNPGLENLVVSAERFGWFSGNDKARLGKLKNLRSVFVGYADGTPRATTFLDAEFYKAIKYYCPKLETINGQDAKTFDPAAGLEGLDLTGYTNTVPRDVMVRFRDGDYRQVPTAKITGSAIVVVDRQDPDWNGGSDLQNSFTSPSKSYAAYKGVLADSPASANWYILVYGKHTRVGGYTNGSAAFRTDTYVSVVDPEAKTATKPHLIGKTNPPKKVKASSPTQSFAGDVLLDKALKYVNGLVA